MAENTKPTKAKKKAVDPAPDPKTLRVTSEAGESRTLQIAKLSLDSTVSNAQTASLFSKNSFGEIGFTESVDVMRAKAKLIKAGDLSDLETTLTSQAAALDTIFNEMARRAAMNMGQHLGATESYMRLALKAQGQCRSTLETLAEVKFPKAAATFIRQANIAGQQQVNNGELRNKPHDAHAHEKTINQSNELLSEQASETLDTARARAPSRAYSELETMGAIDRTKDTGRKGARQSEC